VLVHVLILVHEEVSEAPPCRSGELSIAFELGRAAQEKIIEVEDASTLLLPVVALPDLRDEGRVTLARSRGDAGSPRVFTSGEALRLRPFDLGGEFSEHGAVAAVVLARGGGQKTGFGGDDDGRRTAALGSQSPELSECNGVEGPAVAGSASRGLRAGLAVLMRPCG